MAHFGISFRFVFPIVLLFLSHSILQAQDTASPMESKAKAQEERKNPSVESDAGRGSPAEPAREAPAWHDRQKKTKADPPETLPGTSAMVFYTALVVLIIVVFFVILRRFTRTRMFGTTGVMHVLARKPLSPKQVLYLVEVGPKIFLIGATREDLVTLGTFVKKEDVAVIRAMCMSKSEDSAEKTFQTQLHESLSSMEPDPAGRRGDAGMESIFTSLEDIKKTVRGWKA